MEGFVNTRLSSPYLETMRHNGRYVPSRVDNPSVQREQTIENQNITQEQNLSSSSVGVSMSFNDIDKTVVDTVTQPDKTKKQKVHAAIAVGGSVLAAGGLTLALTKGRISKATTNAMSKLIDGINKKTEAIKQKPSISKLEGIYLSGLQRVKRGAFMVRGAIFNLSPLKDVLFDKFVRQKCGLQKPCDAITNWFQKLSFATVKSSYKKSSSRIDDMTKVFDDVNKRILAGEFSHSNHAPNKSVVQSIQQKTAEIRSAFNSSFSDRHLQKRSDELTQTFDGLGNKVYDVIYGNVRGFVSDVRRWTEFVPEVLVEGDKAKFMRTLDAKKRVITNNPLDNYKTLDEIITKLSDAIDPNHKESREIVSRLKDYSSRYVNLSGPTEAVDRANLNKIINSILKDGIALSKSETYKPQDAKRIISLIRQYGKVINTDKKGAIEEILTMYKGILPSDVYKSVKKSADKAIKSLNKSVRDEGFEYVDKVRDLATGSALTDVALGTAVPAVTTGVAIAAADTKEKKRSVLLKYGIPLFAGIATTMLCTVKLISGGKSLALGSLVSVVGNDLCERLDNRLKTKSLMASTGGVQAQQNENKEELKK